MVILVGYLYINFHFCHCMLCGDYIVYCLFVFVWVTLSMKSTNFGSRYLIEGFSEWDEMWQLDRGTLLYTRSRIGELWLRRSSWGVKMLKGVKTCNAFLVHCLTKCDEI